MLINKYKVYHKTKNIPITINIGYFWFYKIHDEKCSNELENAAMPC